MGASLSAAEVERNDELLQRHLVRVRETGYTDIEGVDSTIYSLYENHCFQLDSTKLIVSHKIFVKREEPEKMKLIEENHKYINDSISVNAHPYFLLSKSIKFVNPNQKESDKVQDLPVLSRQHIRWTLQEKLLSGLSLSYQEKLNIAIQIVIAGMVLHEGLNEKEE